MTGEFPRLYVEVKRDADCPPVPAKSILIVNDGVTGKGARLEITVPKGMGRG